MKLSDKLDLVHKRWLTEGAPLKLTQIWKHSLCRLFDVPILKVNTLDSLFQLATLPEETFKLVKETIQLHSKGELKGEKLSKGSKVKDLSVIPFTPLQGRLEIYINIKLFFQDCWFQNVTTFSSKLLTKP